MKARIAVVDDERRMVEILCMVLRREGHDVVGFENPLRALEAMADGPFDAMVVDLKMPQMSGLELLTEARRRQPGLPVILMTAYATVQTAVEALREGAFDYLQKPFDNQVARAAVARAVGQARLERENHYLRGQLQSRYAPGAIIAESEAMRRALELVRRAAATPSTVLIQGESGTGKELIARALHYHSDRVGGPFVAVNCAAFSETLLESELFGHEKGSFTGASRARAGVFERAEGGTLFLDEIGEVSLAFQTRLLRVIQEREVLRVGADDPRSVDVRLVTATNRDLKAMVREGTFREDLYFRLAVIPIRLPPLRERPEAIGPLSAHFLARCCQRLGRTVEGFSPRVEAFFAAHPWPGNVRELENTVERGVALARGPLIELDDLLLDEDDTATALGGPAGTLQEAIDRATVVQIQRALAEADGNRTEAARRLEIDRTTLYRLMTRHNLG